jgi:hypothetical protein
MRRRSSLPRLRHVGGMRTRFGLQLSAVLGLGAAVHAALIALTPGEFWDMQAIRLLGAAFLRSPLHVYALNATTGSYQGVRAYPWPYLPGYLPLAGLLHWISATFGPTVSHLERGAMSLVDLALAWVLADGLGRLGRSDRERLAGAALVALGPTFVAVAGVHGQIDALAWLPAVAALLLWARRRSAWQVFLCGALIGLGIDIKTTPGLALIALGLAVRDRRELALLAGGAATVVAVSLAPFALTATSGLGAIVKYSGYPGRGGLTALLQPRLTLHQFAVGNPSIRFDTTTRLLLSHGSAIVVIALLAVAACAWLRGLGPAETMVALILSVYVFAPAVLPQYWLWVVPFLILAGWLWAALAYQLAMLPLLVANYAFLQEPDQPPRHLSDGLILHGYVPALWVVTLGLLGALVLVLARGGALRLPPAWRLAPAAEGPEHQPRP